MKDVHRGRTSPGQGMTIPLGALSYNIDHLVITHTAIYAKSYIFLYAPAVIHRNIYRECAYIAVYVMTKWSML